MSTPPDWHELIGAIYDAAMDDTLWTPAVDRIMEHIGATRSLCLCPLVGQETDQPLLFFDRNFPEDFWNLYSVYYGQQDVWSHRAMDANLLRCGVVDHGDRLITRKDLRHTEFYQDFLRILDMEVILAAILFDNSTPHLAPRTHLTFFRPTGAEAFSQQDEQFIRHLFPHWQRALRIRWQMGRHSEARTLRETALDQMAQAVALLDENGRVLFANRCAEEIFREGAGPTVRNQRFTAAGDASASQIKDSLRRALLGVGSSVRLENPSRRQQWVVTFSPLRMPGPDVAAATRILVLVTEPDRPATQGLPAFAQLYGLTAAESRVLEKLFQQNSTQDIADALQIAIKTIRTHLSSLFAKTGTSGQRELLRFYLAHPAVGVSAEPHGRSEGKPHA